METYQEKKLSWADIAESEEERVLQNWLKLIKLIVCKNVLND